MKYSELNNFFLAIDPGKNGGIIFRSFNGEIISLYKMPETNKDVVKVINECLDHSNLVCKKLYVFIEKVGARPMQGAAGMWTFAENYGVLKGIMAVLELSTEFILPNTWQKFLSCQTKGDKKVTYAKAQEMFADQKVTHWNADALLISEYVLRRYKL